MAETRGTSQARGRGGGRGRPDYPDPEAAGHPIADGWRHLAGPFSVRRADSPSVVRGPPCLRLRPVPGPNTNYGVTAQRDARINAELNSANSAARAATALPF